MAKSGYCSVSGEYCPSLDEHHVIPREFGGENGPTILLSPSVHHTIHRCVHNSDLKDKFLSTLSIKGRSLASHLIETIIRSEAIYSSKIQKETVNVSVKLNPATHRKFQVLAKERKMTVSHLISKLLETL